MAPATFNYKDSGVAEFQGLYGPFSVHERVLQKIWERGDFFTGGLHTEEGTPIEIVDAGRPNRQEGPDFKEARLRMDGLEVVGDVEVHFHLHDWWQHQHATAERFNGVVLHVVLHPVRRDDRPVKTKNGGVPQTLVLLPLLNRDLEDYAADEALLEIERTGELEWASGFLNRPYPERESRLRSAAGRRWIRKLDQAAKRLKLAGWDEVCHQMMLEVLGYRRNREAMGRIALRWPLARFLDERPEADALFSDQEGGWKLAGLRPANHPLRRLESYCTLVRESPDWPVRLRRVLQGYLKAGVAAEWPAEGRKTLGLARLRTDLNDRVLCRLVGPGRLNTLACDALLPLAGATGLDAAAKAWFHWYPGDIPDVLRRLLSRSGVVGGPARPHCNGWNQGALALLLGS